MDGKTKWYEGDWKGGQQDGEGVEYYDDGKTILYKGYWKGGYKDGPGVHYDKENNIVYTGTFFNSQKHGAFTVHYKKTNKKFYNILYERGERRLTSHFIRDNHPTFNLDLSGLIASYT